MKNKASLIKEIQDALTNKTLVIGQIVAKIKDSGQYEELEIRNTVYAMTELHMLMAYGNRRARRYRYIESTELEQS